MTALATGVVVPLAACGAGTSASGGPESTTPPDSSGKADSSVERAASRGSGAASPGSSGRPGGNGGPAAGDRVNGRQPGHQQFASLTGIELKPGDDSYDRVVFHFSGAEGGKRMPQHTVEYLGDFPRKPGSGKPVEMQGQRFLGVSFTHATTDGSVRKAVDEDLPTVAEVRYLGGFEKVQEAAIGVSGCHGDPEKAPFDVSARGSDVVVDVSTPNCDAQPPKTRECGDVAFEPQSDHGAFDITATGVGCAQARDMATLADSKLGESYGTPGGFSCLPKRDDSGPTTGFRYTCTRGEATVTFDAA